MPEPYPIPSYACNLWVAGDDLWIAFPGQGPEERGHSVKLPASVAGLQTVLAILKDRTTAKSLRLGNRGTPTQWDLEQDKRYGAILEAIAETKAAIAQAKAEAEAELAELGL